MLFHPPPWISYVNLLAILCVAFFVWLLWRSVRKLWLRERDTADVAAGVLNLTTRVNVIERDLQNVRHDVNAVGHTVQAMQETLGTDIVESEERVIAKLERLMEAQGVILQNLASRPCMVEEEKHRSDSCPEK